MVSAIFSEREDTSYLGSRLYSFSGELRNRVEEEQGTYALPRSTTAANLADIMKLEFLLLEFRQMVAQYTKPDELEVFDLQPLSSRRLRLRVREVKPAIFYFVQESDEED